MLKNGQTYFKNLAVLTALIHHSFFSHFVVEENISKLTKDCSTSVKIILKSVKTSLFHQLIGFPREISSNIDKNEIIARLTS